jgi:hypothetical protein
MKGEEWGEVEEGKVDRKELGKNLDEPNEKRGETGCDRSLTRGDRGELVTAQKGWGQRESYHQT